MFRWYNLSFIFTLQTLTLKGTSWWLKLASCCWLQQVTTSKVRNRNNRTTFITLQSVDEQLLIFTMTWHQFECVNWCKSSVQLHDSCRHSMCTTTLHRYKVYVQFELDCVGNACAGWRYSSSCQSAFEKLMHALYSLFFSYIYPSELK